MTTLDDIRAKYEVFSMSIDDAIRTLAQNDDDEQGRPGWSEGGPRRERRKGEG